MLYYMKKIRITINLEYVSEWKLASFFPPTTEMYKIIYSVALKNSKQSNPALLNVDIKSTHFKNIR